MVQCVHQPGGEFVSPLFATLWEHLRAYIATLRRNKITRKCSQIVDFSLYHLCNEGHVPLNNVWKSAFNFKMIKGKIGAGERLCLIFANLFNVKSTCVLYLI